MIYCTIKGCRKEWYPNCGNSFHKLPKNPEKRKKWIEAILYKITDSSYICKLHFKPENYLADAPQRLKPEAFPSIFPKVFPENKKSSSVLQIAAPHNQGCAQDTPPSKIIKLNVDICTQTPNNFITTQKEGQLKRENVILKQWLKRRDTKINTLTSLLKVLKQNCNNYHEVEAVLSNNFANIHEKLNTKKSDRGVRFSDEVKSFALTLYFYSARAYRFLRNDNVMTYFCTKGNIFIDMYKPYCNGVLPVAV